MGLEYTTLRRIKKPNSIYTFLVLSMSLTILGCKGNNGAAGPAGTPGTVGNAHLFGNVPTPGNCPTSGNLLEVLNPACSGNCSATNVFCTEETTLSSGTTLLDIAGAYSNGPYNSPHTLLGPSVCTGNSGFTAVQSVVCWSTDGMYTVSATCSC